MSIKSTAVTKAIIIDDEEAALQTLKKKIELYVPSIEVIEVANSAKEGLQAIHKLKPDLVFLDIEMPWMNGFEMLQCLGDNIEFDVVFVTAYDQYAIKAFKTTALDYLLKPVDKDDLIACANKLTVKSGPLQSEKLTQLNELLETPTTSGRLVIHGHDTIEVVMQNEITYCQADSNYCIIHTTDNRKIIASKTLTSLESMLSTDNFVRIHRSYIVNMNHIKQVSVVDGSEVVLKDGTKLPVSRRKKDELLLHLA